MSRYHGRYHSGAARVTRELKRRQAEQRNARTPVWRRAWWIRQTRAAQ